MVVIGTHTNVQLQNDGTVFLHISLGLNSLPRSCAERTNLKVFFNFFSPPVLIDEKKNPVYANTSDIALMQQAEISDLKSQISLQQNNAATAPPSVTPTNQPTSAIDLHQIETLKAENDRLKGQLNEFGKKIQRVGSLEQEMAKIHQAYQSLLKHSEKREMLEKSARGKLQAVIINLSDANKVRKFPEKTKVWIS